MGESTPGHVFSKVSVFPSVQRFANGDNSFFDSGKYDSGSHSGKQLLAHELPHTIQQQTPAEA